MKRIKTESNSTAGAAFGIVMVTCIGALAVMCTIKVGLVLFT